MVTPAGDLRALPLLDEWLGLAGGAFWPSSLAVNLTHSQDSLGYLLAMAGPEVA